MVGTEKVAEADAPSMTAIEVGVKVRLVTVAVAHGSTTVIVKTTF